MTAKATIAGAMSEAALQKAVLDLATLKGWVVTHFRPARGRDDRWLTHLTGDPGFPDIVIARGGVALFFEVKTEKEKLTSDQQRWRAALGGSGTEDEDWDDLLYSGGCYAVIRPSRWQEGRIEELLK